MQAGFRFIPWVTKTTPLGAPLALVQESQGPNSADSAVREIGKKANVINNHLKIIAVNSLARTFSPMLS
jgi:hypothetical protein